MTATISIRKSGFSLVEVALAMLVASVGLMSVMALFPSSMESGKKAIDEAQCALFAEEIFAGFQSKMSLTGTTWNSINNLEIGAPAPDMWNNGDDIEFRANHSGTNIYQYKYEPELLDYAVRYVMTVGDSSAPGVKYMRLTIWNGQYGSTSNSMVFYNELFDTGR